MSETPSERAADLAGQLPADAELQAAGQWNPPYCGELDLRIAQDGSWHYQGEPLAREALVRLFASVLRREGERYYLVTPVEKVGIRVDDAPFVAIDVEQEGAGECQRLVFTTQQGERMVAGPGHPLRVAVSASGEPRPYLQVRPGLEALIHRNVFYRLIDLATLEALGGRERAGVWSDGEFFVLDGEPG